VSHTVVTHLVMGRIFTTAHSHNNRTCSCLFLVACSIIMRRCCRHFHTRMHNFCYDTQAGLCAKHICMTHSCPSSSFSKLPLFAWLAMRWLMLAKHTTHSCSCIPDPAPMAHNAYALHTHFSSCSTPHFVVHACRTPTARHV